MIYYRKISEGNVNKSLTGGVKVRMAELNTLIWPKDFV